MSIESVISMVRGNPGGIQGIGRNGAVEAYVVSTQVFDQYIRPLLIATPVSAPRPKKQRPAGKPSYRQRHKRKSVRSA